MHCSNGRERSSSKMSTGRRTDTERSYLAADLAVDCCRLLLQRKGADLLSAIA